MHVVKVGNQTASTTGASDTVRDLVGRAREAADVVLVVSSSASATESVSSNGSVKLPITPQGG